MNFEKAFENYQNRTATEEEKAFVEAEIEKARKINEIIEEMDSRRAVEPAESQDVKKAMNKMRKKTGIRAAVISLIVVLAVIVVSMASISIYAIATASGKAVYSKKQCIAAAKEAVIERVCEGHHKDDSNHHHKMRVCDVERDMRFEYGKLSSAIYVYEIEIICEHIEYEVVVNSITGEVAIVDIGD